ncbi:MAG TPA: VWA domain-containing protein [Vicinamibacterales bacterium]|nr:VWA domain-containing protein [Vicinamibacterales bacterium]
MRPLLAVTLSSLVLAGSALVSAQQGRDEPHLSVAVDVDLVVFNVTVTDRRGRSIPDLQRTDFHIDEDGRAQDVALFDANDVPASVGLIVDNSGSMADKRADVVGAALAFVAASNPRDEMFVVNFNEHAYMGLPVPFTSDARQIHAALLQRPPTGLTALYDALALGIDHLQAATRDRKALVVLSDGGDNASRRSLDEVLRYARQSNATIYTIGIYDEVDRDKDPRTLRKIAGLSGGRAYFPRALDDLERVWRDIAGGIRNQYTVAYHSSNPIRDGAFRRVTITAGRNGKRDLRVAARDGYFAPGGGPR